MARALGDASPDPDDRGGKAYVVDVVPERRLRKQIPLSAIKADAPSRRSPPARMPRLSVMRCRVEADQGDDG